MSRLLKFSVGKNAPASGEIVGDLAKTWEQPDPLTIVLHLDPAAKFDQRAPTNGRVVTAEDVVQSWKRYSIVAADRTVAANSANKSAPIANIEAIDQASVRVKLAFPDALAQSLLASSVLWIQPVEALSGKFDPAVELRGSGPFILDAYQRSVSFTYRRNPDWHGSEGRKPYLAAISQPIIPEQAQSEAQFRAKKLHAGAVSTENILVFARELNGTRVVTATPGAGGPYFGFSWLPGQPWQDVRVRRALSMSLDRDTFLDVLFNPKPFTAAGVKLNTYWNSPMSPGFGAYWLDPKGKNFGPAAAWLQYNVSEARRLLDAAGFNAQKPLQFDLVFPGTQLGRDYITRVETWQSMAAQAGIKINSTSVDYATEYIPKYFRGGAKFEGKTTKAAAHYPPGGAGTAFDPLTWLINHFHSTGASTSTSTTFPQIDEMILKQRAVTEFAARKQGIEDIQRFLADQMVVIPAGPMTDAVDLIWKELHGPGEVQFWPGGMPTAMAYGEYWLEA